MRKQTVGEGQTIFFAECADVVFVDGYRVAASGNKDGHKKW